jgi:toxin ParE1/3/4
MKRLQFTVRARQDLLGIADYIAEHNGRAASRVMQKLDTAMRGLARYNTGRYGRIEGTYEKSVSGLPYIVVYHFPGRETVEILRVIHTRRNWPAGTG